MLSYADGGYATLCKLLGIFPSQLVILSTGQTYSSKLLGRDEKVQTP